MSFGDIFIEFISKVLYYISKGMMMMIKRLSIRMTNKLIHEGVINEQYYDLYKYGIEITISSIIGFLLILVIGVICQNIICSLIYYVIFVCLRMLTGGFHATSYLKCNSLFCLITIFVLSFSIISTVVKFSRLRLYFWRVSR